MPLHDPGHQESIPPQEGDVPPVPGDLMPSVVLSRATVALLQQYLAHQQRRRQVHRPQHLRVRMDGEEGWQLDVGAGVGEPFHVPLHASMLEIFGDDAEGGLLLAVCPLLDPMALEVDGAQHLSVTLEGGQTVAIEITLGKWAGAEGLAYAIRIGYTPLETTPMTRQHDHPSSSRLYDHKW